MPLLFLEKSHTYSTSVSAYRPPPTHVAILPPSLGAAHWTLHIGSSLPAYSQHPGPVDQDPSIPDVNFAIDTITAEPSSSFPLCRKYSMSQR
ncbi:hypothetical protein PITC_094040 [Penicillium italicum]|uniref:Uncharacterized protein n=1 Tax=Penicillium italicum TaxID=40296 RepID=A0A0A2K9R3_PENIT|nr:hypothetical protein PITC_094040 [Penicillium italicum]